MNLPAPVGANPFAGLFHQCVAHGEHRPHRGRAIDRLGYQPLQTGVPVAQTFKIMRPLGPAAPPLAVFGIAAALFCPLTASAQAALGAAQNFAVLASTAVTNVGATVVTGDVGVSPGASITGFPPGVVVGTLHAASAPAAQAQAALTTAYNTAAGLPCGAPIVGDLGGQILPPVSTALQRQQV